MPRSVFPVEEQLPSAGFFGIGQFVVSGENRGGEGEEQEELFHAAACSRHRRQAATALAEATTLRSGGEDGHSEESEPGKSAPLKTSDQISSRIGLRVRCFQ
jgi:hypothetical protein